MLTRADQARLEYLLKLIDDLNMITQRHSGVIGTLKDVEGFYAVMMCCLQLGETLNKLENVYLRKQLPISLAYSMRNIIAHDYLGINPDVIISTINRDIPDLHAQIERFLQETPDVPTMS